MCSIRSRDGGVLILKTAHSIEEINYKATLVSNPHPFNYPPLLSQSSITISSLIPPENVKELCEKAKKMNYKFFIVKMTRCRQKLKLDVIFLFDADKKISVKICLMR